MNNLLTLTHCTHMKVFLKKAEIIFTEVNVTFEEYNEVLQYDLKGASDKLGINKD